MQYFINVFWSKWKAEYLAELQKRQKWIHPQRNMEKSDIVLLKEDESPRNIWPLAIVDEVYRKLDSFLDNDGTLRVGGRLEKSTMSDMLKHPVILPKHSHISTLIARYIHNQTHQGRGATLNAIRESGYWIIGCKGIVSRIIHKCISCRRFCGRLQYQRMASLPEDRSEETHPFTYCGATILARFILE